MNRAESIVDAMLGGAPIAPPKPTTTPTRPGTPSKPRPGTRPWNPSIRPGVNPRPKARNKQEHGWVADASQVSFAEAETPEPPPIPSAPGAAPAPAAPEATAADLCDYIRPGDRVTIVTQQNQNVTGRAVMRNRQAGCWVLNAGGPHGRPVIASEENIVSIRRGGQRIYGK
jgi:hypothetical protein